VEGGEEEDKGVQEGGGEVMCGERRGGRCMVAYRREKEGID